MVSTESKAIISPALKLLTIALAPSACTPITLTLGFKALAAKVTPLINPPPPIGQRITSTSFKSSNISKATVPCPQITSISLNGCINKAPCSCSILLASLNASS